MKKLILSLVLLLLVSPVYAQEIVNYNIAYLYDVDSATTTYTVLRGQNGRVSGAAGAIPGRGNIETVGSSTTVTGVDSGQDVFNLLAVGDIIFIKSSATNTNTAVRVDAKASADSITVSTAVNIDVDGGVGFSWLDMEEGTAATSGWFDVSGLTNRTLIVQVEQQTTDTAGVDFSVQCRGGYLGQQPVQVWPDNHATASTAAVQNIADADAATLEGRWPLNIPEPWTDCRVGLALNTADDGSDAVIEQYNIGLIGERRR